MGQYDFRSLSPIDFEILVRDLLQEELGVTLESFKAGKDLGIDFRYCRDTHSTLMVQCKHFVESGYDAMVYVLQKTELPKVTKLHPARYIFATSVALSANQKDKIRALFSPFIKSSADIFGKDDLNNLLGKFPRVERQTIKLWLASTNVLEEVLHAQIKNASRHEIERIREHARFYVKNESFSQALKILEGFNFCIIAGIPGIGKTILAEMLLLHYCRAGYEVIKVSDDISEAWSLNLSTVKRVFYYDDFLGQTSFSEKLHKNEDQRLLDFVHAVKDSKGVKLVLTTREYVLNQACQLYEKLGRERLDNQKCIVDLRNYTRQIRAQILYNHIYFSDLPERYRAALLANRSYLKVIDHRNYNPRIVQLMTEFGRTREVKPARYVHFFLEHLENPLAVWSQAFERHLSQGARNILILLVSLPHQVFLEDLHGAFQAYSLAYAQQYGASINPQEFKFALRELEGDFLTYEKDGGEITVGYYNPSVKDFVAQYLAESPDELRLLVESAVFYEQFRFLWNWDGAKSGRNTLMAFASNKPRKCESRIKEILSAPPAATINVRRGNTTRKERWPTSYEEKAHLLATIVGQGADCLAQVLLEVIDMVNEKLEKGNADRRGLANLLKQISSLMSLSPGKVGSLMEKGKAFLLSAPDWADDLSPLCDLMEECPQVFSKEDSMKARAVVREVAESIVSGSWDLEPETLREEASALRSAAERLEVDIEELVEKVESQAAEKESERGYDPDEPDSWSSKSIEGYWCSDDEIGSLFSTLSAAAESR